VDREPPAGEVRMSFFEHLEELRRRLKVVFLALMAFFLIFLVCSVFPLEIGGTSIPVPVPAFLYDDDPIANKVFRSLVEYYKPADVNLTSLHPWDGVIVQIKVAMFLALVAASPVSAYEFAKFIGPALKPKEKRLIVRVAAPVLGLFALGVTIAHLVILPFTFSFLYGTLRNLGVNPLFLFVDDFISFVTVFLVAFGLAFELPVIMYGLSAVGMFDSGFWRRNWRFAAIAIFAFGAIVTPDASGVTMLLVSFPMLILYVVGYGAVAQRERRLGRPKSS
jgi:sec-independent protein translocase protein TatC